MVESMAFIITFTQTTTFKTSHNLQTATSPSIDNYHSLAENLSPGLVSHKIHLQIQLSETKGL